MERGRRGKERLNKTETKTWRREAECKENRKTTEEKIQERNAIKMEKETNRSGKEGEGGREAGEN